MLRSRQEEVDGRRKKPVKYDIDGFDVITTALQELVNQFPELREGDEIAFSTLDDASGKAMFPVSGAVIESEKRVSLVTSHRFVCIHFV